VIKLSNAVILYQRLKLNLQPEGAEDFTKEVAEFKANIGSAQAAAQSANQNASSDRDAIQRVAKPLQEFQLMAEYGYALIVPPLDPQATPDCLGQCWHQSARNGPRRPNSSCDGRTRKDRNDLIARRMQLDSTRP
jgi:hypothetical protein